MNRLDRLFSKKNKNILNVYFTAGYPNLDSTEDIILGLEKNGVDIIEIGMPYSDPLADGPTIQESGQKALKNGMSIDLLFDQVRSVRSETNIPLILMGYFNQAYQYGVERFVKTASEVGIDGMILPDLPPEIYEKEFRSIFENYSMAISFLITPQTSSERVKTIDKLSTAFVYMVSNASITGAKRTITEGQIKYFNRIKEMGLKNPRLIGFGISDHDTFKTACNYAHGAIIGSAFIKKLETNIPVSQSIQDFMNNLKPLKAGTK